MENPGVKQSSRYYWLHKPVGMILVFCVFMFVHLINSW